MLKLLILEVYSLNFNIILVIMIIIDTLPYIVTRNRRDFEVWPMFLFLNVILLLKKLKIYFYFTAAGVVPYGGRKKFPRTSSVVQILFYFSPLRSE